MGLEFLVRGIERFGEPGVCISFEETAAELAANVASLGFDLEKLQRSKKLAIDYVYIDKQEIAETGEYDLEALFVRLNAAIEAVGAKRVMLDTPEALFAGLSNTGMLRSELRRLFRWLKEKGVTAVVTGEPGRGTLTRHGIEEYVSDCVILLDSRVLDETVTRRLRVLKYRGSMHGTSEYPFLIAENGISVLPVSSLSLNHQATNSRISTGIPDVDEMLEGRGFYRASSVLVTGAAGTGKTSLGCHFVQAACERGERALFFSFEESPEQVIRNMRSVGLNLEHWRKQGLLQIEAARPSTYGLETHLVRMHHLLATVKPKVVLIDSLTSLLPGGAVHDVRALVLRIIDSMKLQGITAMVTSVGIRETEMTSGIDISSLFDSWILLRQVETNGERNRLFYIVKSRGMAHSNQIRELVMTARGMRMRSVYIGPGEVLTGSARVAREAEQRHSDILAKEQWEQRESELHAALRSLDAKIAAIEAEKQTYAKQLTVAAAQNEMRRASRLEDRQEMSRSRGLAGKDLSKGGRSNGRRGK
jgi:circadian clock protein KaiC